jgi:broad specificity phosphatase PhoE
MHAARVGRLVGESCGAIPVEMHARTRLYLVRHGEVDPSWHDRLYGALDVPLSERGRDEAARVAMRMRGVGLAAVVSSGLARTEHGAACLRDSRGLQRLDDPELRELDRGAWAGLTRRELAAREPGAFEAWLASPARRRPPQGESLTDLLVRVRPRVAHWTREHPGGALALVTHGWVIRVLVCEALAAPLDRAPRLDIRTGDVVVLDWPLDPGGVPVLTAFAQDQHPDVQLSE